MRSAFAGLVVLQAELHMLQPGLGERRDLALAAQRAGGDEVAVEAVRRRLGDQRARGRAAPSARRRRNGPAARRAPPLRRARAATPRRSARSTRARARPGWSNRGSAADSDASARPAGPGAGQSAGIGQASLVREILQHRGDVAGDHLARRVVASRPARRRCASTLALPSTSCRISTACSSGSISRSGAIMIQRCRVSSKRKTMCGARRQDARAVDHETLACHFGHEGAGRDQAGIDIGEIERIELGPQHVALEAQRRQHLLLVGARPAPRP